MSQISFACRLSPETGNLSLALEADLDGFLHHRRDFEELLLDRGCLAPDLLVLEDDLRDRLAFLLAQRGELGGGRVGEWLLLVADRLLRMRRLVLADHESAADRKVEPALDLLSILVERDERDPVRMGREALVAVPLDVLLRIEGGHLLAPQVERLFGLDPFLLRGNGGTVEGGGRVAFEPEHRGEVGEVSLARERHRAVELDLRLRRSVEEVLCFQLLQESLCGDHRTEGVRTGRPDSDLVDIEHADCHGTSSFVLRPSFNEGFTSWPAVWLDAYAEYIAGVHRELGNLQVG